ncbi:DUF6461 domain-containing protein [Streptomyces sp. 8L]|uniref:DUF6461 domain-containing protein n=1 Tax=Streptomyces sp. 8L TaxID=2877242 RepID=UPI001CD3B97F|nr:DUF6461 domain-containing protein [Streptomyces sp. 8L]MCA1217250.1 DUF6461 domain-containing protein [Streptomyces sp. 8L]
MAMTTDPKWIYGIFRCHCLTIAENLEKDELLRRLGCNPDSFFVPDDNEAMQEIYLEDAENYDTAPIVIAGKSGSWAFALEPTSVYASIPERLRQASRGTKVFCSSNVVESLLYYFDAWENGRLVVHCDVRGKEEPRGASPDLYLPNMRRAGFFGESRDYSAVNLALSMSLTGVAIPYPETYFPFPDIRQEGMLAGRIPALNLGPEAG